MKSLRTELEQLLTLKRSKKYYAERLNTNEEEIGRLIKEIKEKTDDEDEETIANIFEEDFNKNTAVLTYKGPKEIKTKEDLIRECEIDETKWNIDKMVCNAWGKEGNQNWQVKAWLSLRITDKDILLQKDMLLDELKKGSPKVQAYKYPKKTPADLLLELSLPDLHVGKLAWASESGNDYDIDIAVKRFTEAVDVLLSRVNLDKVERIHIPLGNDAIHVDNPENTTTAGTAVDTDGRFPKILKAAKELFIHTITRLTQIAPVDVTIVRGNHDSVTMFLLGEILDAWFHNNDNVNINNAPKFRKYYQFGDCGFQITHGDQEKHAELGLIFATEQPALWADTKFRFCKLGHLHKSKKTSYISLDSYPGFQIEILPSLSGTDEWHYAKGYLSNKQAKAFLYSKDEGEIGCFTYTVNK